MGVLRGTVYYVQHRELTTSEPHYLIVLNPKTDSAPYIVFGVITSGIEFAKKRIAWNNQPEKTLVLISPSDYSELDHDSVVDCNTPVKMSKWEFTMVFAQYSACRKQDMPANICQNIVNGIMASTMVAQSIKKLLS